MLRESRDSTLPALLSLLSSASVRRLRTPGLYRSLPPNGFAAPAKRTFPGRSGSPVEARNSKYRRAQRQCLRQTSPRDLGGSDTFHQRDPRLPLRPCFRAASAAVRAPNISDNGRRRNGEYCEIRETDFLPTIGVAPW